MGTFVFEAFAGMKILKFASRFPSTEDFKILNFSNETTSYREFTHFKLVFYQFSVKHFVRR